MRRIKGTDEDRYVRLRPSESEPGAITVTVKGSDGEKSRVRLSPSAVRKLAIQTQKLAFETV